jgi:hypothetical protein
MYHPAPRPDERNLEFIELFNSESEPANLTGYRISGAVDYTFPPGTMIPARGYLVVAAAPADVQAVYGINNVIGPFSGNLPNSSGLIRLRNPQNAILLEIEYSDLPPWPLAADGAGHSLVLARPSYGEGDVRAWSASDRSAVHPGVVDTRAVIRTDLSSSTNSSPTPTCHRSTSSNSTTMGPAVDLSGCTLSDRPDSDKFVIPTGTIIPPKALFPFTETQLAFALSTLGEEIYLKNPAGNRVIDAIRFEARTTASQPVVIPMARPISMNL